LHTTTKILHVFWARKDKSLTKYKKRTLTRKKKSCRGNIQYLFSEQFSNKVHLLSRQAFAER